MAVTERFSHQSYHDEGWRNEPRSHPAGAHHSSPLPSRRRRCAHFRVSKGRAAMKDNQDISSRKLIDRLVLDPHWGAMQGLLATTFELRPDFLEMDFLPSVFGLAAWDDRSWATG